MEASCWKDMNCVLLCLQKPDSYKIDESKHVWLIWLWRCETRTSRFQSWLLKYISGTQSSCVNSTCVQLMTHMALVNKNKTVKWLEKPFTWLWPRPLKEKPRLAPSLLVAKVNDQHQITAWVCEWVCWMTPPPSHLFSLLRFHRNALLQRKHQSGFLNRPMCLLLSMSETEKKKNDLTLTM